MGRWRKGYIPMAGKRQTDQRCNKVDLYNHKGACRGDALCTHFPNGHRVRIDHGGV